MKLRAYVKSHCAPIWWEQGRQVVVNSGSMCVIRTPEKLFGITNCHVLMTYEKHKAEKPDIFCQLGSAPFDPVANQMSRSEHWDLATFTTPISLDDTVVYGLTAEFVSFRGRPNSCTAEDVSFQIDRQNMTWLPNVDNPLAENANLSGMSGGPCFRLIPAEDRIELSAFIHEGRWDIGVIFARQGCLITASGELAPVPPGVRQRTLRPREDE